MLTSNLSLPRDRLKKTKRHATYENASLSTFYLGMNDQQLVKNCLRGKREAQHLLYETHAEYMLGVCYRYTKCMSDAEDVLQEGFIKVFKNLHQYKSDGELAAW